MDYLNIKDKAITNMYCTTLLQNLVFNVQLFPNSNQPKGFSFMKYLVNSEK